MIRYLIVLRFGFYLFIAAIEYFRTATYYSRWFAAFSRETYSFLPKFLLDPFYFMMAKGLFLISCTLCALSFKNKIFSVLAAFSGGVYFMLMYSSGFEEHHLHLIMHVLVLFAYFENSNLTIREFIILVRVLFIMVFFTSAITKIRNMGIEWFADDTHLKFLLRQRLTHPKYAFNFAQSDLNYISIKFYSWISPIFKSVIIFELLSPLALLRIGRFLIVVLALFQIFASQVLFAVFIEWVPIYLFWISDSEFISLKAFSGVAQKLRNGKRLDIAR